MSENSWLDQTQYDMLKRCSEKKDMTEWNDWRKKNPDVDIQLRGACFREFFLEGVNFIKATVRYKENETIDYTGEVHLEKTNFESARLNGAWFADAVLKKAVFWHATGNVDFHEADLEEADLSVAKLQGSHFNDAILINSLILSSRLEGATFTDAKMMGCKVRYSIVDGATMFLRVAVNKFTPNQRFTDFEGTSLANARIDPGTRQLLEYNIRRMNWENWYKVHQIIEWPLRFFWWISDYGLLTGRIILTFFALAILFALTYFTFECCCIGVVEGLTIEQDMSRWSAYSLALVRSLYFSIVTMTTTGFGDLRANPLNIWGHVLITLQVLLGYVLLGALITRFAVLFSAGGPVGRFEQYMKAEKVSGS